MGMMLLADIAFFIFCALAIASHLGAGAAAVEGNELSTLHVSEYTGMMITQ